MINLTIELREMDSNGGEWVLTVNDKLIGVYGETKRVKNTIINCIDNAIQESNREENSNEF